MAGRAFTDRFDRFLGTKYPRLRKLKLAGQEPEEFHAVLAAFCSGSRWAALSTCWARKASSLRRLEARIFCAVLKPRHSMGAGRCRAYRKNLAADGLMPGWWHRTITRCKRWKQLELWPLDNCPIGALHPPQARRGRGTGSMQSCDLCPTRRAFLLSGGEPLFAVSRFGARGLDWD